MKYGLPDSWKYHQSRDETFRISLTNRKLTLPPSVRYHQEKYLSHLNKKSKTISRNQQAPVVPFRYCLRRRYFTSSRRGIGNSFQLAIIPPLYSIIGQNIATAQSYLTVRWLRTQLRKRYSWLLKKSQYYLKTQIYATHI